VPLLRKFAQYEARDGRSSIVHQVERRNTKALGGHTIDGAHLVGGKNFHSNKRW
jgi:hypothetical protein